MSSPGPTPLDVPSDLPPLPPASASVPSTTSVPVSASTTSSARAPHASQLAQALAEQPTHSTVTGRGRLSPILSASHSPTSLRERESYEDEEATPTQAELPLPDVPAISVQTADSGPNSLEDRTPTPAGPLLERATSQDRHSSHLKPSVPLGDETAPSDNEEDEGSSDEDGSEDAFARHGSEHGFGARRRPSSARTAVAAPTERTPLLGAGSDAKIAQGTEPERPDLLERVGVRSVARRLRKQAREITVQDVKATGKIAVGSIPAVILGCALLSPTRSAASKLIVLAISHRSTLMVSITMLSLVPRGHADPLICRTSSTRSRMA